MARISRNLVLVGKVLILIPGMGCLLLLPLLATYAPLGMSDGELLAALATLTAAASAAVGSGGLALILGLMGDRDGGQGHASTGPAQLGPGGDSPPTRSNVIPFPLRARRGSSNVA